MMNVTICGCQNEEQAERIEAYANTTLGVGVSRIGRAIVLNQIEAERPYSDREIRTICNLIQALRDWDDMFPGTIQWEG